jgi:HK97 gp10 family phage protein
VSDYRELTALRDRLHAARRDIKRAVNSDMDNAAEDIKMKMRELAPVDTGYLRDNIAVIKTPQQWTIGPVNVPYARAQEYGSKPHVIIASPGKVLVFQAGGQTRFAKSVKHPGNKPHPYIRPAGDWARENLRKTVAVTGASMLRKDRRKDA